ncbi:MAG: sugar transferase [Sphingomicrobium sp.]
MLQLPYPTHLALNRPDPLAAESAPLLRALDLLIATALLAALAPVLLLVAFAVWASDGGAPFYRQQRLGRGGRAFRCFKFRTMTPDAGTRLAGLLAADPAAAALWQRDRKLARDPRVTPLGRLLRLASIDELPQLANVLLGDMSLVGPRPIVAAEVGRYGRCFAAYCEHRPGLTGLWQVSGRSGTGYARRLACDRLFARRRSALLYLRILAATVPAVFTARGAC